MHPQTVLVLNQNYEPINICNHRRAIKLIFKNKAESIENSTILVYSENMSFPLPSVIRLYAFIRRPHFKITFNRRNVLRRDDFACQYCGTQPHVSDLTIDHIIPRSKGGANTWGNVVAACKRCNNAKADQTLRQAKMSLRKKPKDPRPYPALLLSWRIPTTHDAWKAYFYTE